MLVLRTLRARIVLLNLLLVSVVQLLLFWGAYRITAGVLHERIDRRLTESSTEMARLALLGPAAPGDPPPGMVLGSTYYFRVWNRQNELLHRSPNMENLEGLPDPESGMEGPIDLQVTEVRAGLSEGQVLRFFRVITVQHETPEGPVLVQVAADSSAVEEALGSMRQALWVVAPLSLMILAAATWIATRRSLSPISRISAEARRRTSTDLYQPLPVPAGRSEVVEMTVTINNLLERLREAARSQERFTANAAHELKSPVARLLGEAQVLLQQPRELPEYRAFAEGVEDDMRHLARVVESLLILARTDRAEPPTTSVAIHDLVINAIDRCLELAKDEQVTLEPTLEESVDPQVRGDAGLLEVMLENLLRNAVRHAPAGSAVQVRVTRTDRQVRVVVRDHGRGIPAAIRDHVFERFFTTTGTSTAAGGSGLGLAIARKVARFHGGDVTADDAPGGGAEFRVELPLA